MCCSPWGHKESDTTEQLNWTELKMPEGASLVVQWLRLHSHCGVLGDWV